MKTRWVQLATAVGLASLATGSVAANEAKNQPAPVVGVVRTIVDDTGLKSLEISTLVGDQEVLHPVKIDEKSKALATWNGRRACVVFAAGKSGSARTVERFSHVLTGLVEQYPESSGDDDDDEIDLKPAKMKAELVIDAGCEDPEGTYPLEMDAVGKKLVKDCEGARVEAVGTLRQVGDELRFAVTSYHPVLRGHVVERSLAKPDDDDDDDDGDDVDGDGDEDDIVVPAKKVLVLECEDASRGETTTYRLSSVRPELAKLLLGRHVEVVGPVSGTTEAPELEIHSYAYLLRGTLAVTRDEEGAITSARYLAESPSLLAGKPISIELGAKERTLADTYEDESVEITGVLAGGKLKAIRSCRLVD